MSENPHLYKTSDGEQCKSSGSTIRMTGTKGYSVVGPVAYASNHVVKVSQFIFLSICYGERGWAAGVTIHPVMAYASLS